EEKKSKGGVASTLRGFDEMENKVGLSQILTKTRDDVVPHPLSVAPVHDDYLVGASDDEIETKGVGSGGYARTPSPEGDSEGSKAVEVKYEEARFASIVSDKEGISQIFGEVSENQLEQCPKGDFRSVARVPVVLNSGFVASIEDEEDADGDGVVAGVLKESDESRPGDPVDEEDETDPKPKGGDVSVSEVVTGEGVNNKVISVSPVFLIRDGVGDAAFEDFVDSGVKVKQVREKSEDSCSARHVFKNLPESPLEANLESGKPKALSPFFQGC
ncbi:hypothetical protein U1Q18_040707, partial [Sarracenia purpurea var. burkii]